MNRMISKNNISKIIFLSFSLMMIGTQVYGQETADFARSMGKMNVVIAVIVTVFIGIVVFLIYMERRLANLEKQIDETE